MHSTLGGWIATRSSGMQSDLYGDIADMVRSVRVITPAGILSTRPVPGSSSGPSVNEMVLGSEGRIGIITEAVVQIHRIPERREIRGYFLPTWESGLAAMAEIAGSEATALFTRLYDTTQTAFLLATSKGSRSATLLRLYLSRVRGYQLDQLSLSFIGFTGSAGQVRRQKRLVASIMSKHGGVGIGTGPGMLYEERKFDTPYIRDFLLDRDTLCDVSETAAPWSRLEELYAGVMAAAQKAFASTGVRGEVMCHLAHAYHSGASLNFTFAFRPEKRSQRLYQYDVIKGAIGQAFLDCGGTLSHHHGVGVEQARWLEDDVSAAATTLIRGLLRTADPGYNFNPGKIVN
jgi:alkyldihydroxyacetonephosphate synthase